MIYERCPECLTINFHNLKICERCGMELEYNENNPPLPKGKFPIVMKKFEDQPPPMRNIIKNDQIFEKGFKRFRYSFDESICQHENTIPIFQIGNSKPVRLECIDCRKILEIPLQGQLPSSFLQHPLSR